MTPTQPRQPTHACVSWRAEYPQRERLEVLHDGSEMELVARTGEAPKPHSLEAMVDLQMGKPHLDPLSLIS